MEVRHVTSCVALIVAVVISLFVCIYRYHGLFVLFSTLPVYFANAAFLFMIRLIHSVLDDVSCSVAVCLSVCVVLATYIYHHTQTDRQTDRCVSVALFAVCRPSCSCCRLMNCLPRPSTLDGRLRSHHTHADIPN